MYAREAIACGHYGLFYNLPLHNPIYMYREQIYSRESLCTRLLSGISEGMIIVSPLLTINNSYTHLLPLPNTLTSTHPNVVSPCSSHVPVWFGGHTPRTVSNYPFDSRFLTLKNKLHYTSVRSKEYREEPQFFHPIEMIRKLLQNLWTFHHSHPHNNANTHTLSSLPHRVPTLMPQCVPFKRATQFLSLPVSPQQRKD